MSRGTDLQLDDLHALVADSLIAEIERFSSSREPVPPQLYAQAIKFLKDNGIDTPSLTNKTFDRLAESIPDFGEPESGNKPN